MIAARTNDSRAALISILLVCATVGALTAYLPFGALLFVVLAASALVVLQLPHAVLLVFFAFLVIQDPLRFAAGGDDTAVGYFVKRADEALLFALAAWTLLTNSQAHEALKARRIHWAIAGCLGGIVLSSIVAHVEVAPAVMDFLLFSKPFLVFALGCSIAGTELASPRRLGVLLTFMTGVILFALVFLLFPNMQDTYLGTLRVADVRMGLRSASGFFDGPGPYAWFCAATFAIAYAGYLAFERRPFAVVSIIAAAFVFLSWRRKSIGGVVAMVLLAVLIRAGRDGRTRRRAVLTLAIAALVGVTVLAPLVGSLWELTVREYSGDPSRVARVALHQASFQIAKDNFPLGAGLASFGSYASRVYYSDTYHQYGLSSIWGLGPQYPAFIMDTFWPMVLGEGGIVTLIPYLIFVFMPLTLFWNRARQPDLLPADRFLAFAGLFILVGSLLESTSSPVYSSSMQSALALVVPAIAWGHFTRGGARELPAAAASGSPRG